MHINAANAAKSLLINVTLYLPLVTEPLVLLLSVLLVGHLYSAGLFQH